MAPYPTVSPAVLSAKRCRRTVTAGLAGFLLVSSATVSLVPAPAAAAPPAGPATAARSVLPGVTGPYLSGPPLLPGTALVPDDPSPRLVEPPRAPTRGHVKGRVLAPNGRPLAGVLVQGVRFSDLGRGINFFNESPVLARTGTDGRFRLPQLRERYLVRVCDAAPDALQCGGGDAPDRYAATYAGPDGVRSSWVTHTRMFKPRTPSRAVGTIKMRRYAVLRGTFTGGAQRSVRLLRANGTEAARTSTDAQGRYRFAVVPGRYRVEVDRHEGLRTASTVAGFRSKLLRLRAAAPTRLSFRTRPAAVVSGLVTEDGRPLPDELVVITDARGRWAAGAVTDENGRYVVESLRPGRYTVQNSSAFSGFVPLSRAVTLATGTPARADLEFSRGGAVELGAVDPGRLGEVAIEIRDADGFVVKSFRGRLEGEPIGFSGLRDGRYDLYVRGALQDPDDHDAEVTEFPWTWRSVNIVAGTVVQLGDLRLDRATINLSGLLPRRAQVKITALPYDAFLRADYVQGPRVTSMALNWTEQADADRRYVSRGLVPGRYTVQVTASLVNPPTGGSTYRGNIAATHQEVQVGTASTSASFSAPAGGIVRGTLRYAGTKRALIAPVGYRVVGRGDRATLFPTVSSSDRRFGQRFRVDRLHAGPVTGRLLDATALREESEQNGVLVPDVLLDSAPVAEPRTPYWLASRVRKATVQPGKVTNLGTVKVAVRR